MGFSSEAITHVHEAADYVGMGHADALVTHAEGRFNMLLPPSRIHRVLTWMPGLQNEGMRLSMEKPDMLMWLSCMPNRRSCI